MEACAEKQNFIITNMAGNANAPEKAVTIARFQWGKGEKVENLIKCLEKYRMAETFEGKDFNSDKAKLYEAAREEMARVYVDERSFLGPINVTPDPFHRNCKEYMNENHILDEDGILHRIKSTKFLLHCSTRQT